jgi:hypothetical protein
MSLAEQHLNLWERELKALKRPAPAEDRPFVPIPLGVLIPGERLTFALFLKVTLRADQEPTFSSCLAEGEGLNPCWLDKLRTLGLEHVYFHENDLGKAIAYLNNHLLLQRKPGGISPQELLILREHLTFSLRLAITSPQMAAKVALAREGIQRLLRILEQEAFPWKLIWNLLYQDYTLYNHSVNVAVLGTSLGVFLRRPRADCLVLGVAGLFHDIGLTQIREDLVQKREPLTAEDWEILKKHPCLGYRLLKGKAGLSMGALRLVLEHHELADGTGYPQRLPLNRQHPLTRVLSLLEAYDGMTIFRPYRQRLTPYAALKALQEQRGGEGPAFEPRTLKKFIEFLALG